MDEFQHKVYGLNRQARCMASVLNSDAHSEFIVGTIGLDRNNKIHRILIDDENNTQEVQIFDHEEEIWSIGDCPWDPELIFAVTSRLVDNKYVRAGVIYRMTAENEDSYLFDQDKYLDQQDPENSDITPGNNSATENSLTLINNIELGSNTGDIQKIICNQKVNSKSNFLSMGYDSCGIWDFSMSGSVFKVLGFGPGKNGLESDSNKLYSTNMQLFDAKFIGSGDTVLMAGSDGNIFGYDIRSKPRDTSNSSGGGIFAVKATNWGDMLVIDGNPNLEYQFSTGGEDGAVRIFDLRKLKHELELEQGRESGGIRSMKNLFSNSLNESVQIEVSEQSHSHWVYSVEYNPFHDQLLLTSGSDSRVNLFNIHSVSSANLFSGLLPKSGLNHDHDIYHDIDHDHNLGISLDFDHDDLPESTAQKRMVGTNERSASATSSSSYLNPNQPGEFNTGHGYDYDSIGGSGSDDGEYSVDNVGNAASVTNNADSEFYGFTGPNPQGRGKRSQKHNHNHNHNRNLNHNRNRNRNHNHNRNRDFGFGLGDSPRGDAAGEMDINLYAPAGKHDGLVAQFDNHESSVYRSCWSKTNPWVFASLSFDGRVVVSYVPPSEKYKILL